MNFIKTRQKKDNLEYACKKCIKERNNKYYKNDPNRREKIKQKSKNTTKRNGTYVFEYLEFHPCVDCGENNPVVLEFDHVRDIKTYNITFMVHQGHTIQRIQKEIDKCDVRCSNCHKIKTAKEQGWYKYLEKREERCFFSATPSLS